jgi:hypothetical protein
MFSIFSIDVDKDLAREAGKSESLVKTTASDFPASFYSITSVLYKNSSVRGHTLAIDFGG